MMAEIYFIIMESSALNLNCQRPHYEDVDCEVVYCKIEKCLKGV